jgi:putative DNA primase/helicase
MVGYLLTGCTNEQVLHFLYGFGANGKSVFCEIVQALLGEYAIVASPELVMMRRHGGIPNDIARLRGVRAAIMNETTQGSRFDEAKLKDLTGGDRLTGRFLHQEFFDFAPTHKLIIRGNHKPAIAGTDEAIWRRFHLVVFNVTIPPEERDKGFVEKLRPELPGILRWAVHGCLEWQQEGLKPPATIVDAVRKYREESDTLGHFIDECCNKGSKLSQVKAGVFFQRYQQFAEQAGERWMPSKELAPRDAPTRVRVEAHQARRHVLRHRTDDSGGR